MDAVRYVRQTNHKTGKWTVQKPYAELVDLLERYVLWSEPAEDAEETDEDHWFTDE
jgi:hypothetical protein